MRLIVYGLMGIVLLSGCMHRRRSVEPEVTPAECFGEKAVTFEPAEGKQTPVAVRIEDAAKDAYDRYYYLRQEQADHVLVTTRDAVPLKGAESAALLVNMKRGSLTLTGGASTQHLMDAEFEYSAREPIPILAYQTKGRTRVIDLLGTGKDNDWQLKLSERVPIAVRLESAGGVREFNFEDIPLTELSLQSMGGPTVLNLAGDQPYLTNFQVRQRQGSIGLTAGGAYDSLVHGKAVTCRGDYSASFTGFYNRLTRLELGSRDGDVDLDLTGCWQKICRIRVVATCGNLRIKLPAGIGCSVKIDHSCASICAIGLHRTWSTEAWVNPAFGKTDVYLDIDVAATCGKIDLILDSCCCPPWVW